MFDVIFISLIILFLYFAMGYVVLVFVDSSYSERINDYEAMGIMIFWPLFAIKMLAKGIFIGIKWVLGNLKNVGYALFIVGRTFRAGLVMLRRY